MNTTASRGAQRMIIRSIAVVLLASASFSTHAAVFCIQNAPGLHFALIQAGNNSENDVMKIVAGSLPTYDSLLGYSTSKSNDLYLLGGYNATCTALAAHGAKTTFVGSGNTPLAFLSMYGASTGKIVMQRIVWQNGAANTMDSPFEIITSGSLLIDQSAFLDLHGGPDRPHAVEISVAGSFDVRNSVFVHNVSGEVSNAAAIYFTSLTDGAAHITNNTFTDNYGLVGTPSAVHIEGTRPWSIANNIVYDNSAFSSLRIPINAQLRFNDIDSLSGTPALDTGNVSVDPHFAGSGDHHLAPNSPLVNAGFNAVPEGIGPNDFDGNPRVVSGIIDIGAYELQDVIFANGFEAP